MQERESWSTAAAAGRNITARSRDTVGRDVTIESGAAAATAAESRLDLALPLEPSKLGLQAEATPFTPV